MLLIALVIFLLILILIEKEFSSGDETEQSIVENCSRCGTEVSTELLICPGCRQLLREHCPRCGKSKVVSHCHCPWCGEKSQARGQHAT